MAETTPQFDKRYTLQEAQRLLYREKCNRQGHDYRIVVAAQNCPERIECERCGESWGIAERG